MSVNNRLTSVGYRLWKITEINILRLIIWRNFYWSVLSISWFVFVCPSIYPSFDLSVVPFIRLLFFRSLSFHLSVNLSFFWSLSFHLSIVCRSVVLLLIYLPTNRLLFDLIVNLFFCHLSINVYFCLSFQLTFFLYISLSLVVLSICLSFHQPFLSIYCFVFLSFCLLFHPFLSIHLLFCCSI